MNKRQNNSHGPLPVQPSSPQDRDYVGCVTARNRYLRVRGTVTQKLEDKPRGHARHRQGTADAHDRRHQPQIRIAGCSYHCRPLCGVCASCPNHSRGAFARQNHLRNICSLNRNSAPSAAPPSACGRITRLKSSRRALASAFGMPIRCCAATAGFQRRRSWHSTKSSSDTQRGVWYGSQGPQRIVIGRSLAEFSSRLVMKAGAPMPRHLFSWRGNLGRAARGSAFRKIACASPSVGESHRHSRVQGDQRAHLSLQETP